MTWGHFLVAGALLGAIAWYLRRTYRPSRQFVLDREPEVGRWNRLYPEGQMPVVSEALAAVTEAFLLRDDDVDRLLPGDRLMDIYRAAYPDSGAPDALEFETLWQRMKDGLQLSEEQFRGIDNMTVGQVIDTWLRERGAAQPREALDKSLS